MYQLGYGVRSRAGVPSRRTIRFTGPWLGGGTCALAPNGACAPGEGGGGSSPLVLALRQPSLLMALRQPLPYLLRTYAVLVRAHCRMQQPTESLRSSLRASSAMHTRQAGGPEADRQSMAGCRRARRAKGRAVWADDGGREGEKSAPLAGMCTVEICDARDRGGPSSTGAL